jgi:hypothetical protein
MASLFGLLRLDGNDLRLRPIEERRARSCGCRRPSGILFSETLAAEGAVVFAKACELLRQRVEATGQLLQERAKPQLAQDREPEFVRT